MEESHTEMDKLLLLIGYNIYLLVLDFCNNIFLRFSCILLKYILGLYEKKNPFNESEKKNIFVTFLTFILEVFWGKNKTYNIFKERYDAFWFSMHIYLSYQSNSKFSSHDNSILKVQSKLHRKSLKVQKCGMNIVFW